MSSLAIDRCFFSFSRFSRYIPVSFTTAFYVANVVARYWDQFISLPWPDRLAYKLVCFIPGQVTKVAEAPLPSKEIIAALPSARVVWGRISLTRSCVDLRNNSKSRSWANNLELSIIIGTLAYPIAHIFYVMVWNSIAMLLFCLVLLFSSLAYEWVQLYIAYLTCIISVYTPRKE